MSGPLAHVDDADRAEAYVALLEDAPPSFDELIEVQRIFARMLFFSLWPDEGGFNSYDEGLSDFHPAT